MSGIGGITVGGEPYGIEAEENLPQETEKTEGIAKYFFKVIDFFYPVNPVTQERQLWYIPTWIENFMGRVMYPGMVFSQGGRADPIYDIHVQYVLGTLKPHAKRDLPYQVTVINKNVVNAWCLPGGKMAVYKLILERIQFYLMNKDSIGLHGYTHPETKEFISYDGLTANDVIAALLGHEMTHADARHTARRLEWSFIVQLFIFGTQSYFQSKINAWRGETDFDDDDEHERIDNWQTIHNFAFSFFVKLGVQFYFLFGSRCHEYESDKYGTELAVRAGYNPAGALFLQEILKRESHGLYDYLPSLFQKIASLWHSHPSPTDRQVALANHATLWTK